jgi:septal ring factor EnvC (AmiA/AmiB activator)
LDAISTYNRHIEMCNRVVEQQESGLASGRNDGGLQQALADLQAQLATERSQKGRLEAELKQREELHSKLEERLTQLETATRERRNDPNAELVARLERAEAELHNRRPARK